MFEADNPFMPQARLAVRVLRHVAKEKDLALKGGTAINLFFRDLPRLSVDLDLTYLKVAGRDESLVAIRDALERISADVEKGIAGTQVQRQGVANGRLVVREGQTRVTVEVNTVLRAPATADTRARAGRGHLRRPGGDSAVLRGLLRWKGGRGARPPAPARPL